VERYRLWNELIATLTITDYRNRSTTYTWNDIEVLNYTYPTIHSVDVVSSDSDGDFNPCVGVFMNIVLDAQVQSLINSTEKNELYYRVGYKLLGGVLTLITRQLMILMP
jgi:hypothetical protein